MEGHTHFRYGTSSAQARPIIHGGRSLIVYSIYIIYLCTSGNRTPGSRSLADSACIH